jgi:hypothetical protein
VDDQRTPPALLLKQGFTYVRTVVLPHNPSGALFQRPAERIPLSSGVVDATLGSVEAWPARVTLT